MYRILKKRALSEFVREYEIYAPHVAQNAKAGQFVIVIVYEGGERVPFTICDSDAKSGVVRLLVQEIGYTTKRLNALEAGDSIVSIAGPLGKPTDIDFCSHPVLIGGGIGAAVIYPQVKHLTAVGKTVDVIIGARTASLLCYEDEFRTLGAHVTVATDDGSRGLKGNVITALSGLLDANSDIDLAFAVGPMPMMRAVAEFTRSLKLETVVSMNTLMVDGTGMCGCCRLTVDGRVRYACVDGPEFDGHAVDWAESLARLGVYKVQEKEHMCRLLNN